MESKMVNEMVEDLTCFTVETGEKFFGKTLDYSEESVKVVDDILEIYHNQVAKSGIYKVFKRGMSEEDLQYATKIWGGYVGEVIRRNYGGDWFLENDNLVLKVGESIVFPISKVYKRIVNGEEDSIWLFYKVTVEYLSQIERT